MNSFLMFAVATEAGDFKIPLSQIALCLTALASILGVIYARRLANNLKAGVSTLITGLMLLAVWGGTRQYQSMQFDAKVKDYVLASYKTEDPEKAKKYLVSALEYLKDTGANKGHSAVFAGGQTDDLEEWNNDLSKVLDGMGDVKISVVSVSNDKQLPWKRGLTDLGYIQVKEDGAPEFKYPAGMPLAPNNYGYCMWGLLAAFITCIGGLWSTVAAVRKNHVPCDTCKGSGQKATA